MIQEIRKGRDPEKTDEREDELKKIRLCKNAHSRSLVEN